MTLGRVEAETRDAVHIVRVMGEVDLSNAEEIGAAIEASMVGMPRQVVMDHTETRHLDSTGIALLLRLADRLKGRRQVLSLVVPAGSPIRSLLELTGLSKVVPMTEHPPIS